MTIQEAIQEFEDNAYHESLKPEISFKAKVMALAALKEQEERKNPKPLTLEELRQMEGV